jgi:hypothetical protein
LGANPPSALCYDADGEGEMHVDRDGDQVVDEDEMMLDGDA